MSASTVAPRTPITIKADRSDERVRRLEEAVLLIRGEWPAVALGLCENVNRSSGLVFVSRRELERAIEETTEEAFRLVESLYGHDAALALAGPVLTP